MTLADLITDWQRASDRGIKGHLTVTKEGILLGADTAIAKRRNDEDMACEIDGREDQILALVGTAYGRPVSPSIIPHLRRAYQAYRRGDLVAAQRFLGVTGLRGLGDEEPASFRLFLADRLLQSGLTAEEFLTALSDGASSSDSLGKANPNDPKHPGWPAGTVGGKGGKFRPKDGTEAVISEEWKERIDSLVKRRALRERALSLLRISAELALNAVPGVGEVADVAMLGEMLTMAGESRQRQIDAQAAIDFIKTLPHSLEDLQAAAGGPSEPGYDDHHIVTQGGKNAKNIPEDLLQQPDNIVRVPTLFHELINAEYSKASKVAPGMTVYQWLQTQPFDVQYEEGVKIMRDLKLIQ
jgi:hypothetical protein